jgi:predicted TIM-barrel fold metal-dependent hydrolase
MLREAQARLAGKGRRGLDRILTDDRFYITTQKSDDLPWLLSEIGDDNLVIGTDYGHKDTAVEIEALKRLGQDGSIPSESAKKIIAANPGKLYGLG